MGAHANNVEYLILPWWQYASGNERWIAIWRAKRWDPPWNNFIHKYNESDGWQILHVSNRQVPCVLFCVSLVLCRYFLSDQKTCCEFMRKKSRRHPSPPRSVFPIPVPQWSRSIVVRSGNCGGIDVQFRAEYFTVTVTSCESLHLPSSPASRSFSHNEWEHALVYD